MQGLGFKPSPKIIYGEVKREYRFWSDNDIAILKRLHNEGRTYSEISKILRRPVGSIASKLNHIATAPRYAKYTREQIECVYELWRIKVNFKVIARIIGIDEASVKTLVRNYDFKEKLAVEQGDLIEQIRERVRQDKSKHSSKRTRGVL